MIVALEKCIVCEAPPQNICENCGTTFCIEHTPRGRCPHCGCLSTNEEPVDDVVDVDGEFDL